VRQRRLVLLLAFVFIDLLGYSLFLPLLPFYAGNLGAGPIVIGSLIASNALAQLIAAPIIGRLSDRFGRKPLLIFSLSGTLVGFLILGLVEPLGALLVGILPGTIGLLTASLWILFFSRILDGLFGGDISLAQAYITDITDEENRAGGLGLIGAAFGLGFIVGPALGGILANWNPAVSWFAGMGLSQYAVPAFVAVGLSAVNLLAVIIWLPESLPPERRAEIADSPRSAFTLRCLWDCVTRPRFETLLRIRFLYILAFTLFTANFALWARYSLELTDQTTSFVLTYVGILVVLVQGLAVGPLAKRFPEGRLILGGAALMAVTLLAWGFVPNLIFLLIVITPMPLAGGLLNTVINSSITKSVFPEEVGGALGLSGSLDSLARVIAPTIAGVMLQQMGAPSLGISAFLIMALVLVFSWWRLIVHPDPIPRNQDDGA
jgi:DHA1 family tetracycline resistance protein-like MFS transporter